MVTCDRIEVPPVTKYFTVKNSNNLHGDCPAGLNAISANAAENYFSHYQTFCCKDESIGPRQERFFEFYVHRTIQTTNLFITKSLYLQPQLVIWDTVLHIHEHFQVLVINNSDDFVFLPERPKLCHFEPTPPDLDTLPNHTWVTLLTAQSGNQSSFNIPQKSFTMADFNF